MQKGMSFEFLKVYLIEFEIQIYSYFDLIHNHFPYMKEERKFLDVRKTWERAFVAQNKRGLVWNKRERVGGAYVVKEKSVFFL